MPNGLARRRAIREALAQAGIKPSGVDYVGALDAGSTPEDDIKVQAAATVYGQRREADRPLLTGSVKTYTGHLGSAAGVAGLRNALLSMKRGIIPHHLHFNTPNEYVDRDTLPVKVTSAPTAWTLGPDRPPWAAASAFGISGANAHIIVQGYLAGETADPKAGDVGLPAGSASDACCSSDSRLHVSCSTSSLKCHRSTHRTCRPDGTASHSPCSSCGRSSDNSIDSKG